MDENRLTVRQLLKENFRFYKANDLVLVRKLERSIHLSEEEVVEILKWWHSLKSEKQSLLDFLITHDILTKDAGSLGRQQGLSKIKNLDNYINLRRKNLAINELAANIEEQNGSQNVEAKQDVRSAFIEDIPESSPTQKTNLSSNKIPRVGLRLGKCLLTEIIGKGTSSIVFKGLHETLQIPVAIKFFLPENRSQAEIIRKQFGAEAQTLAKLNHRSIVRILDFEDSQHPYLILEYVDGKPLDKLIRERGRIDYQQAAYYIYCVSGGLTTAHESGIIHRDIKPANILITKNDKAKLADLGIAHITHSAQIKEIEKSQTPSSLPGTPAYLAPELAFTETEGDARSDIYSLGATFYHAVTGRHPFEGDSVYMIIMKHVHEPLLPAHEVVEDVPKDMSELIQKMMAKKPAERFQNLEELLPDLLTFFLGSGLYSVNESLTPVEYNSSRKPKYGTKTRLIFNAAKKAMEASNLQDTRRKQRASKKGPISD